MKKTSLLPLVIIVIVFLVTPILFWIYTSRKSSENIRGVNTKNESIGISVNIKSSKGTWDLNRYLCKDREECLSDLFSGKSLDTVSGGVVDNKYITIKYSSDWDAFGFVKIFVKPGWGSTVRKFNASLVGDILGINKESVVFGGADYDVVLVPVSIIDDALLEVASFSD